MIKVLKILAPHNIVFIMKGDGLKARVARGSIWTLAGYGGSIFLRMFSSLILTRIFMPEIFGIMAIITAVSMAIQFLSDVGITPSIIQNPRGTEPDFLRTAWTLQAIRGFVLWGILILVSRPLALLYDEPDLQNILPVVGLGFVIQGFVSTSIPLHRRYLKAKHLVIFELGVQVIALIITVVLALILQSIWAIIYGGLLAGLVQLAGSYLYLRGGVVGFKWDRCVVYEMVRFGKWIFVATLLTFIVGQGDRLLLGTVISKSELGLYNLATLFSQISFALLGALVGKIIMPALSEIGNNGNCRKKLSAKFNSVRVLILSTLIPIVVTTAVFGEYIIKFFYELPYHDAGWMLQILSAGMVVQIVCMTISPIFLSKGDSFRHMLSYLAWSIIFISSMLLGYKYQGLTGVIFGISLAPLAWFPIISILAKKHVDINHKMNMAVILGAEVFIGIAWWFMRFYIPQ